MLKTGIFGRRNIVVEVEKSSRLPELTGDLKESLKTLEFHPGFNYLMQRLKLHKAQMTSQLREGLDLNDTQLRYLQAGIYWAGWVEEQLQSLTHRRPTREPTPTEAEEFDKLNASLELVGIPT